jgi:Na+/H+-dicarboxylate symporter
MDMGRTSINVVGNCLAAVVMARWEGSLDVPADTMPDRVATLPRMRALQVVKGT